MHKTGGFTKYIKQAFIHHWNLLAMATGIALGFISGQPDVVLPLVAAGELIYLSSLATNSKFQRAIDAAEHKAMRIAQDGQSAKKAKSILTSLSKNDRARFEKLRSLCFQLKQIADDVKGHATSGVGIVDEMQMSSINRLLWIYLKLLYSKNALDRFFETIDENEIQQSIDKAQQRLRDLGEAQAEEQPALAKRRKSLQDTLQTGQARLENYRYAQDNHEFIELELDRLYTKIAGLGEIAINRQNPNNLIQEVDSVTESVKQTEKAMGEIEFLTGLASEDETPELLDQGEPALAKK